MLNGHRQIINPGSVGQPRDANPKAAYAILDLETNTFEHRRIPYDIRDVQTRMRRYELPERLVVRLEHGW
jgi:diadenosine tetraphosphatase ApaH/serine/threonine PP2A family protein phosphatase